LLIKDLILLLEKEIEKQKPYEEMFGEASIEIDVFDVENHVISYKGFSSDIKITSSPEGSYRILTAWLEAYK
jgi:hypothetical protein